MLYIGTDRGLYRWFPGAPWPIFHALQDRPIAAIAAGPDGRLLALDSLGTLTKSTTGGVEWEDLPIPRGSPTAIALRPERENLEILLATIDPLALHRQAMTSPENGRSRRPLAYAEQLERRLARSVRALTARFGGSTGRAGTVRPDEKSNAPTDWRTQEFQPESASYGLPRIRSIEIPPDDPATHYVSMAGQGVWVSKNAGGSWSRLPGLPDDVFTLRARSAGHLWAATSNGVWSSKDSGGTWTSLSKGLEQAPQVRALAVNPADSKRLLAGTAPGEASAPGANGGRPGLRFALYESKDTGASWTRVARGFPEYLEFDQIADIEFDPADPAFAVIALASGEMWYTKSDGAWYEPLARGVGTVRAICPA
jgi:photosystem II stability/assembly factor-like uncharacterized protein